MMPYYLHYMINNDTNYFKKLMTFLKTQRLPSSKSTLGLEPLLVEIEHFLDTTQRYETPGFLIFKCQNAHRPPQPQDGRET